MKPVYFLLLCLALSIQFSFGQAQQGTPEFFNEKMALARQGDADAQFWVGRLYSKGQGVTKDYGKAIRWYGMAAAQGNLNAQSNIGFMYHHGQGVMQDYSEAMRWYRKAADQGNIKAQNNIGTLYENGQGVTQDFEEAIIWYAKAAEQGDKDAIKAVARLNGTVPPSTLETAKPKVVALPNLQLSDLQVQGLGTNNTLDGLEKVIFSATLTNMGKGAGVNMVPELSSTVAALSLKGEVINQLEAGGSIPIKFTVQAPDNLPNEKVTVTLVVKEGNKRHADPVAIGVPMAAFLPPALAVTEYKLDGADNYVRLGAEHKVIIQVENKSNTTAKAVKINLQLPDNVDAISEPEGNFGDISGNDFRRFEFSFSPNKEYVGKEIKLLAKLTEQYGRYGATNPIVIGVNAAVASTKFTDIQARQSGATTRTSYVPGLTSDVDKDIPARKGGIVPNRYALIIGNEDYKGNQTGANAPESNVAFAKADALSFKRYAQNVLGVEDDHIILATDMELNQMKREINRLKELIRLENGQAEVLFFYSGHGLPHPETKKPVLLAIDKTADEASDCLELEWIAKTLTSHPHSRIVMFVDACFSGVGKGQVNLLAKKGTRVRPATNALEGNCLIISSSSADEPSEIYDEQLHGFFTYHLLKALKTNNTAPLTTQALFNQLSTQVQRSVLLKKGTNQTPTIQSSPALGDRWKGWMW